MRPFIICLLVTTIVLVGVVQGQSACNGWGPEDWASTASTPLNLYFGLNDGGGTPAYNWKLLKKYAGRSDVSLSSSGNPGPLLSRTYMMVNQVPIEGGLNMTSTDANILDFKPTASLVCESESSALWGPSYPDYRMEDYGTRGRYQNIEIYVHYSAPKETSYIRIIYFIKNNGTEPEPVRTVGLHYTDAYGLDVSPITNGARYYTAFPFQDGDMGLLNTNPAATDEYIISSVHARGQKAREKARVFGDMSNYIVTTSYNTLLDAGAEFALMFVHSFGVNKTLALKNAAEIDTEPAHIFHDLTADQLSLIRNWGGCEVIIGPTTTVTVTPPSQCSSGLTSAFTVQASSTRTDFTTGFTHRVIGAQNIELVAPQSSNTLAVPNDAGSVTHQLWYKECLVKETAFTACAKA